MPAFLLNIFGEEFVVITAGNVTEDIVRKEIRSCWSSEDRDDIESFIEYLQMKYGYEIYPVCGKIEVDR